MKDVMEHSEPAHPYGLLFWPEAPRPTKIVFPGLVLSSRLVWQGGQSRVRAPVCMETNVP